MTRGSPTDLEAVEVLIPCAYCGQPSGEWCRAARYRDGTPYPTGEGPWARWLHDARTDPVWRAWRIGCGAGEQSALYEAAWRLRNDARGNANTSFHKIAKWLETLAQRKEGSE